MGKLCTAHYGPLAGCASVMDGPQMPGWRPRVHCELGPVLINRTAVYKMCTALPGALAERGFRVHCSALLARVSAENAEPQTPWDRRLYELSKRWLGMAIERPRVFNRSRLISGLLPRWRHQREVSLFLDPLYTLFYGTPRRGVVMVYDLTTVTQPGWHHAHVSSLYEIALDALALGNCQFVATCQRTADELRANWGIPPQRVTVLALGLFPPARPVVTQAVSPETPFLLFVGNLEPRKNVSGLIRAFALSNIYATHGIRLRIIGSLPPDDHPTLALAQSTAGVEVAGFVSDAELAQTYERCVAFVYPSYCEGFGLPLLEAMHRGCVCLATSMGASPEIAGDAAIYVDPYAIENIAAGLRKIVALAPDERERLARRARERSLTFTWERFYDGLSQILLRQAA
jgi:glycosyltransferase involved in cell wall biosynthesis